jgi:hypothetical protein
MENDPKTPSSDDETLPTNDELPSLDAAAEDTDPAESGKEDGAAKTLVFPSLKSSQGQPFDDSFGRPDVGLFPETGTASSENEPETTDGAMPLQEGTGWESVTSISKPASLRARIGMDAEEGPLPDEEEAAAAEVAKVTPRHEATVTPFPGTHRVSEPAPSDLLRGVATDIPEEMSAQAADDPAADAAANQDALADAVQSALRNIYGGYSEQQEDGADQGFTVADALAGPEAAAAEELAWSEARAQAADWRTSQSRDYDADPDEQDFPSHRRQERAASEMSLSDYAARASLAGDWQPDGDMDDIQRIMPFAARDALRGRGADFDPEASIIRGGYFPDDAPQLQQWGQTSYVAPQNARGSITPTYVPATATPVDQLTPQGPDSGHLLGAAGLGLIGGIALAGVLAVFVFNSFVDESGQAVSDPKVVERLSPTQTAANPPAQTAPNPPVTRSVPEPRSEEPAPAPQIAAAAPAEPPAPEPQPAVSANKPKLMATAAAGTPNAPIKLNIALMSADVGDALVSLKGLPKEARLSTGIDVGGGQWLLPPGRLKDLTVTTPGNAAGNYQLEAQLLKDDAQTSISDAVPFSLNVAAAAPSKSAPAQQQPSPSAAPSGQKPDNARLALLPDDGPLPETDFLTQILIRDGNKKMREGDIAGARRLYEQAAQSGNAEAALAMGRSYDPTYFEKLTVKTGKPDPATAFEWYKRALDGGLVTAKVKIDALKQWLQK